MSLKKSQNQKEGRSSERLSGGVIKIGSQVSIVDLGTGELLEFKVVFSAQLEERFDEVSAWSPMGKALLGRRVGESIYVVCPKGTVRYQILKITEGE
jgi:transcription elongation factor GreA